MQKILKETFRLTIVVFHLFVMIVPRTEKAFAISCGHKVGTHVASTILGAWVWQAMMGKID
jgi:hypothetical protein